MNNQILDWIGNYHFVFLHFPIALIVMTVVSELLYWATQNPLYDHASRFMIIGAALTAIPTALCGYAFSYNLPYTGPPHEYFWWHRFFRISTTIIALLAAVLRELPECKKGYYISLFFLFISVNLVGYFGGSLTFGVGKLWPPFL